MNSLWQNLRFGVRMLVKSPGFAAIPIATLALGIGADMAIFSVVNAVLLRPSPFAYSERLVSTFESLPGFEGTLPMDAPNFHAFTNHNET